MSKKCSGECSGCKEPRKRTGGGDRQGTPSLAGVKKLDRIWVGAFAIPPNHRLFGGVAAEVTLIGHYDGTMRATTEHDPRALLGLITMCRKIANDEQLPLRFLEFSAPREVPEEEIQEWLNLCSGRTNIQ